MTNVPCIFNNHLSKNFYRLLQEHGIHTTSQLVTECLSCLLDSCRGLGKKFFSVLRIFLNSSTNTNESMTNYQRVRIAMNKSDQNNQHDYSSLYLFGKVIDRTRRKVPRNNPTAETLSFMWTIAPLLPITNSTRKYLFRYSSKSISGRTEIQPTC